MLKMLVKANRAKPQELQEAERELNRLKLTKSSNSSSTPTISKPSPNFPKGGMPTADRRPDYVRAIDETLGSDEYTLKQKDLTMEANRLRQEQAQLSNMLHKVPRTQACPELTERILALQNEIEDIWDEKKFLERNADGVDMPAPVVASAPVPATVESIQHKAVLTVEVQKLREKRAKLKKKLSDLSASESKRAEWTIELAHTDAAILEKNLAKEALN